MQVNSLAAEIVELKSFIEGFCFIYDDHEGRYIDAEMATPRTPSADEVLNEIRAQAEKIGFWHGSILAIAEIYRNHGDSVGAKEALDSLGGELNAACSASAEYDVRVLREVINTLPLGDDAEYTDLKIIGVGLRGKPEPDDEAFEFAIVGNYGGEILTLSTFPEREDAQKQLDSYRSQLGAGGDA